MSDFSTTFREYASFGKSAIGTVLPLILIGRDGSRAPSLAAVRSIEKLRSTFPILSYARLIVLSSWLPSSGSEIHI